MEKNILITFFVLNFEGDMNFETNFLMVKMTLILTRKD